MPDEIVDTTPETPGDPGAVQPSGEIPPEEPHVDEPPDPSSMQAEIEQLRQKKEKYEADAKYWREQKARERAEYFREKAPQPAPPAPQEPKEPQVDDFQDYNAYVSALADYRADQKIKAWERRKAEEQSQQTVREKTMKFSEKLQEGLGIYEDFDRIISDPSATHMNNMVVNILMDLDNPAPVAYYLAKNRAEGIAISRMTPYQAALAINKIEAEIGKTIGTGNISPPKKTITNAPPPITPVGSRETGTKDPEKMTGKEYEKWLKERGVRMY